MPPNLDPEQSNETGPSRSLILFGIGAIIVISGVLLAGKAGWLIDVETLTDKITLLRDSPWGIVAVIGVFILGAFIGAPQYAMIFAAVAAFGPALGGLYSWVATLISGTFNFWIGRYFGEAALQKHGNNRVKSIVAKVAGNAFTASLLVRLIPSGPFLLVNMAFGMSQSAYFRFMAGMALGTLPKILIVVLAGQGIASAIAGRPFLAGFILFIALSLFVLLYKIKRLRGKGKKSVKPDETA